MPWFVYDDKYLKKTPQLTARFLQPSLLVALTITSTIGYPWDTDFADTTHSNHIGFANWLKGIVSKAFGDVNALLS